MSNMTPEMLSALTPWIVLLGLWTVPWKGYALWKAARRRSVIWFVVLLIVNTVGILPILYIFIFSKMGKKEEEGKSGRGEEKDAHTEEQSEEGTEEDRKFGS